MLKVNENWIETFGAGGVRRVLAFRARQQGRDERGTSHAQPHATCVLLKPPVLERLSSLFVTLNGQSKKAHRVNVLANEHAAIGDSGIPKLQRSI